MLLENINANIEDMVQMSLQLQATIAKSNQVESQNRKLRAQVHELRERNEQMSLNILKDQAKITNLGTDLETAKKDIEEYLKIIKDLREMNKNLEEKNDEMVVVIKQLRKQSPINSPLVQDKDMQLEEVGESEGNSFFVSVKKEDKKNAEANYDTNIRESKVISSGNPMAQTKKFPGVVPNKETFKNIRSRKGSKKAKKSRERWIQSGNQGEIRELLTDSSKTSKADNKIDEAKIIQVPPLRNKSQTQPGLKLEEAEGRTNVYNSHRPDSTLNSLKNDLQAIEKMRSRSKPIKEKMTSGTELRNKYQALRSKQKIKLYKGMQNEVINKDIEKRLKLASKSPRRENKNYLDLDQVDDLVESLDVRLF